MLAGLLFVRSSGGRKVIERLDFFHQVTGLLRTGLKLSFRPKLIVVAALRNHLIHITRGVDPVLAAFGESQNMAKRFFGLIEMTALQVRHGLIP